MKVVVINGDVWQGEDTEKAYNLAYGLRFLLKELVRGSVTLFFSGVRHTQRVARVFDELFGIGIPWHCKKRESKRTWHKREEQIKKHMKSILYREEYRDFLAGRYPLTAALIDEISQEFDVLVLVTHALDSSRFPRYYLKEILGREMVCYTQGLEAASEAWIIDTKERTIEHVPGRLSKWPVGLL